MYTLSLGGFLAALYIVRPIGMDFAMNPLLNLLIGVVSFLIVMCITNVLPINYHHKKHGIISTDGWAAIRFRELRDELWNDGRAIASTHIRNY